MAMSSNASSKRRQWIVLLFLVGMVALGFFLRSYWNLDGATAPDGTYVLSGNDPYYHKHAIDQIAETWTSVEHDPLLNYPLGAPNPNPPLYQWSVAVGGEALTPFAGGDEEQALWWSTLYSGAIWGALTVIPVFLIARLFAGPWAGVLAGFLVATSPEHIGRTNLGFADHDALVIFLTTFGFYFLIRAVHGIGDLPESTTLGQVGSSFNRWFRDERRTAGSSIVAGGFFGAVALAWKGFPYLFGVALAYLVVQLLINQWRNRDVAHPFYCIATALVVATLMSVPYYAAYGLMHFWNPALFLTLFTLALGLFFLATQRYPFILVVPGLILLGVLAAVAMLFVFPDIAQALLSRFVYFRQSRLYETIAEAHPSDFASLAFTIGPIPFFLYFAGFPWLAYRYFQGKRASDLFLLLWAATDLYMAISAVRFQSTAVPTFTILAGATTVWIVRQLNLPNIAERYRMAGGGWRGMRRSSSVLQVLTAIFVVSLIIAPNVYLGVDAGIPANTEIENSRAARDQASLDVQQVTRELGITANARRIQVALNQSQDPGEFRLALDQLETEIGLTPAETRQIHAAASDELGVVSRYEKRLGAFGQNFLTEGWRMTLTNLSTWDTEMAPTERPGVIAWWDYGHWIIYVSEHPTVADNFQNGYRPAGAFLVAQNETHAVQILAARHAKLFDVDEYVQLLVAAGLPEGTAVDFYNTAVKERFPFLEFSDDRRENLAASVAFLLSVEEADGKRIRYAAVDSRMLPMDMYFGQGDQGIESPGIFYAPVTLAGEEADDYVEPVIINAQTGQKVTQAQVRQLQKQLQQVQFNERYDYKAPFFESMFYRMYVGLPVNQPSATGGVDQANPFTVKDFPRFYQALEPNAPSPEERREEAMLRAPSTVTGGSFLGVSPRGDFEITTVGPGFGLKHFRLVYANPTVRLLEFTPGAVVAGRVAVEGEPLAGARVTVFDDAGEQVLRANPGYFAQLGTTVVDADLPHDSVLTDAEGRYSLIAPFSTGRGVRLIVSQETAFGAAPQLTSDVLEISREAAEAGEVFTVDFDIETSSWSGVAFLDEDRDGARNATEPVLDGVTITMQGGNVTTGADGTFRFADLVPGTHNAQATATGYRLATAARITLQPGEDLERDIAFRHLDVELAGSVEDEAGDGVANVNVVFDPHESSVTALPGEALSGDNGTIEIALQPGVYVVNGTGTDILTNEAFEVVGVEVAGGTGASIDAEGFLVIEPGATGVELLVLVERHAAATDET